MSRATWIACALILAVSFAGAGGAGEKWVPERVITICTSSPGGGLDVMARMLAPKIGEYFGGATVVIENIPAGGSLAAETVYKNDADGYTILCNNNGLGTFAVAGHSSLTYNDFDMLCLIAWGAPVFHVAYDSPVKSMTDLIKWIGGEQTVACHTSTTGLPFQPLLVTLLKIPNALENTAFVTYDTGKQCATAIATHEVDWGPSDIIEAKAQWIDKQSRPLAIFRPDDVDIPGFGVVPGIRRFIDLTDEEMVTGFTYRAFTIKKGTPEHIRDALTEAVLYAYNSSEFQDFIARNSLIPAGLVREEGQKMFVEMARRQSWALFDNGYADENPEKYGIERP